MTREITRQWSMSNSIMTTLQSIIWTDINTVIDETGRVKVTDYRQSMNRLSGERRRGEQEMCNYLTVNL